ncbi:receptor-type tyrosine-protein phosphatase S-like isoform X2 [Dysidea avara]|uniref:receptor-type tyrosine-protein phosphatase S-like isoform X2 n=1 Tax=Dysidea avara TaxID=196820 RepID=UPI00332405C5
MAVRASFFKLCLLVVCLYFMAIPSAEGGGNSCNLVVDKTSDIVVGERIEINCKCDDDSELLVWRFRNGNKVPQTTEAKEAKNTNGVYFTRPKRDSQAKKRGSTLVIPEFSVDLNQSVFRCVKDGGKNAKPRTPVKLIAMTSTPSATSTSITNNPSPTSAISMNLDTDPSIGMATSSSSSTMAAIPTSKVAESTRNMATSSIIIVMKSSAIVKSTIVSGAPSPITATSSMAVDPTPSTSDVVISSMAVGPIPSTSDIATSSMAVDPTPSTSDIATSSMAVDPTPSTSDIATSSMAVDPIPSTSDIATSSMAVDPIPSTSDIATSSMAVDPIPSTSDIATSSMAVVSIPSKSDIATSSMAVDPIPSTSDIATSSMAVDPIPSTSDIATSSMAVDPIPSTSDIATSSMAVDPIPSTRDIATSSMAVDPIPSTSDIATSSMAVDPIPSTSDITTSSMAVDPIPSTSDIAISSMAVDPIPSKSDIATSSMAVDPIPSTSDIATSSMAVDPIPSTSDIATSSMAVDPIPSTSDIAISSMAVDPIPSKSDIATSSMAVDPIPSTSDITTSSMAVDPIPSKSDIATSSMAVDPIPSKSDIATSSMAVDPIPSKSDIATSSMAVDPIPSISDIATSSMAVDPIPSTSDIATSSMAVDPIPSTGDIATSSMAVDPIPSTSDIATSSMAVDPIPSKNDIATSSMAVDPIPSTSDIATSSMAVDPTPSTSDIVTSHVIVSTDTASVTSMIITSSPSPTPNLPVILEHPSSSDYVVAATSDRITIGCVVEGDGYVYWQKDGVNISDSFKTISPSGNNLTVVNVTKNDTGDYRCIAVNSAGSVTSSDANITISGLIEVSMIPPVHSVAVYDMVQFTCEADGYRSDQFKYQWGINGTNIDGATDKVFTISSVREGDSGTYQCVVTNHWNDKNTSNPAQLIVSNIIINDTNSEYYTIRGLDAQISCNVAITPHQQVDITWFRNDNNNVSLSTTNFEKDGEFYSILSLYNIRDDDRGLYSCSVSDGDTEYKVTTNVIVEYAPTIVEFAEVDPVKVEEPFNLLCSANGVPSPTIVLYKDGDKIQENPEGFDQITHSVTSATLKDNGTYTCNASSNSRAIGEPFSVATKSIEVMVQDKPDRVRDIAISVTNLTAVNITWSKPDDNNSPITHYVVRCRKCRISPVEVKDDTFVVIDGLMPDYFYEFSVAAVNEISEGRKSDFIKIQIANSENTAIRNLTVTTTTDVSVTIQWMDPPLYGSMITGYLITATFKNHNRSITYHGDDNSVTIDSIIPNTMYNISVAAVYRRNVYTSSSVSISVMSRMCQDCAKPVVMEPSNKELTGLSFTLRWPSMSDNPLLDHYNILYTNRSLRDMVKRQVNNQAYQIDGISRDATEYTITDLTPYSTYCFWLRALFSQDSVRFTDEDSEMICDVKTPLVASSAPTHLAIQQVGTNWIQILWSPPDVQYGIIDHYIVYYLSADNNKRSRIVYTDLEYRIIHLNPATSYTISVSAVTRNPNGEGLEGPKSNSVSTNTSFAAPAIVGGERPKVDTSSQSVVIFTPPVDETIGRMSHYKVVVVIGDLSDDTTDIPDGNLLPYREALDNKLNYYVAIRGTVANISHTLGTGMTIGGYYNQPLRSNQKYGVFVRVYSAHDESVYSTSELSSSFEITSEDDSSDTPVGVIVGVVVGVLVVVILVLIILIIFLVPYMCTNNNDTTAPTRMFSKQHEMSASSEAQKSSTVDSKPSLPRKESLPFINTQAVEIVTSAGQPTTLCIEPGGHPPPEVQWFKDGNPVTHHVLSDGSLYMSNTRILDGGNYTVKVTNSAGHSEEAIKVEVVQPIPPEDDLAHPPIKVEDFAQHVAMCRSNIEEKFNIEYKNLDLGIGESSFSQHNAKISVNRTKNRYINILPYDHSRVPLGIDYSSTGSDYINASFIEGYVRSCEYIATQGPVSSTFGDFWKMIWEKRCSTIVMLTNLKEDDKIKCHQYWPSYGSIVCGKHKVTLKSVECLAEYTIRVFTVEKINGSAHSDDDTLEVHQFHYTVWPDHGVPECGTPLLSFHNRVEKFHKRISTPMVVHCSAGVGRTGTFIVIDTQLQKIKREGNVDVFNNVRMLRYSRNHMVQTQVQYTFIHDVLLEAIMCGDTSIGAPIQNIIDRLKDLESVDKKTNETLYSKQFKTLTSAVLHEKKFAYTTATAPKNVAKNRYSANLAPDENYVALSSAGGKTGYINASKIDGYRQRNAYIVTQGPLEGTVTEFWQMIWESKTHAIVMLSELEENGQEHCYQYWPDAGIEEYGSYTVEMLECDEPIGDWFKRQFKLSQISKPNDSRFITQFHFQNWPLNSCPEVPSSTIDMLESIERVQRRTGNGAITVHCNNGIGRSGTFCALMSSLERFKAEQMADIFQTVKKMRIQRAGMVETVEQYKYLHRALLEAIQRYDTYSNFTI